MPIKYDDRRNVFTTIGNFCSWQCSKAYAIGMNSSKSGEYTSLIAMMRRRALGKYMELWPAPARQALQCFGGTLTIDKFRSFGGRVEPPQVHFPYEKRMVQIITEPTLFKRPIAEGKAISTDLRLKRSKPVTRPGTNLENVLGIKRKAPEH